MLGEEKAMELAARVASDFLEKTLAAPLSEFGLLVKDEVKFWRWKNQVKLVVRADEILKKRGVSRDEISGTVLPDHVIPLLEYGKDVSAPSLSEMFSNLLANTMDPTTKEFHHPKFAQLLSEMTTREAEILSFSLWFEDKIPSSHTMKNPIKFEDGSIGKRIWEGAFDDVDWNSASESPYYISFENLQHAGLLFKGELYLSHFGRAFATSCGVEIQDDDFFGFQGKIDIMFRPE